MPKRPKPENAQNPLRQLRGLLSEQGEQSPISQNQLSALCDIPIDTIRSIEAGRRTLNSIVQNKISAATRAFWNGKQMCWTLEGGAEPFTYLWYRVLKPFYARKPPNGEIRIAFMHQRLDALFARVSGRDWHLLARRVNECLEGCKDDLKIQGIEKLFDATAPESAAELMRRLGSSPSPTYLNSATISKKEKLRKQKRSGIVYRRA
jgi:hypothetical protein